MKKLILFLSLIITFNTIIVSQSDYHKDRILVKLKGGTKLKNIKRATNEASIEATGIQSVDLLNTKYSCNQIRNEFEGCTDSELSKWYVLNFDKNDNFDKLIKDYKSTTDIFEKVEVYPIPVVGYSPNDPLFDANGCKAFYDINMPQAWDVELGNGNVVIGIIDNGLDWRHPDISINNIKQNISGGTSGYGEDADRDGHTLEIVNGQIQFDVGDINGIDDDGNGKTDDLAGWDFVNNTKNILPANLTSDHGTSIFGIIAAAGNNNTGALGVAFNNKVIHCKAGEGGGINGDYLYAITYLADMGVKVINMSFFSWGQPSGATQDAINYAYQKGCVVVACAGFTRDGIPHDTLTYPASLENVISAGVLDCGANLMRLNSNVNEKIDILGSQCCRFPYYNTTTLSYDYGYSMHSSGTTALCSGVAALLFSHYPNWNNDSVANQILMTCTNKDDLNRASSNSENFDFYGLIGNGLLNAYKALTFNGTINENTIWSKHLIVFHNINVISGTTLTLRSGTNLEFQSGKTFNVYGNLIIQGNLTINKNINIMAGGSIQILSGSQITFNNGASLIVNGTLTANGTSTNKITFNRSGSSGTWGGIQFNSGSSGNLQYSTIQNATNGISFTNTGSASIQVSNCTIQNNTTNGIYLYNSSPLLTNNRILSNGAYGINCDSYSSPKINNNTIKLNSYSGIRCNYFSSPASALTYYGAGSNVIKENLQGINSSYNCNVYFGSTGGGGSNSIFNNTGVEISADYGCNIWVQYNWWGSYPPPVNEFSSYQSVIYNEYALGSDPNPGRSIIGPSDLTTNASNGVSLNVSTDNTQQMISVADNESDDDITKYKEIFKKEKNTFLGRSALVMLENSYWKVKKEGFADFVNKEILSRNNVKDELTVLSYELINHSNLETGKHKEAITNLEKIKNELLLNENIEKNTLYSLGSIYFHFLNDKLQASKYFNELKQKYPGDELTFDSDLLMGNERQLANKLSNPNQLLKITDEKIPGNFELFDCYPNPFNPVTTITYQLPKSGSVTLKIFDILGNEVKTLVNEQKEMGKYTVQFDASSLASGMYLYQIKANEYLATKKMLLVK